MTATATRVYTSSTDAPFDTEYLFPETPADDAEDFCFVCGRATDHFAEHDDLVDAGKAVYEVTRDGVRVRWVA